MKLVFFDLETGGLDSTKHPIIQFAAVAVETDGWVSLEELELKIRFDVQTADPSALEKNSHDAEVWQQEAVARPIAIGKVADFFRRHSDLEKTSKAGKAYKVARLVGHNASRFDADFLVRWFQDAGIFCPADCYGCLDTLQLARWCAILQPNFSPQNFKLETLASYLNIDSGQAHDALSDVRMTVRLTRRLIDAIRLEAWRP